jgi:cytochrome c-type biogenesis protein
MIMGSLVITSLLLGLLTTTSPCIIPLYPGYLAYLSGQKNASPARQSYFLGFFVLAGVLTMMLALGGLIALLAVPIGSVLVYFIPFADLLIFALGILLLFDRNPFASLPQFRLPALRHPFLNAYIYGLLFGPIAFPCSGPMIVGIFALSFTAGEAINKLWVFLWFGIGLGIPLMVISLLSGTFQRQITTMFAHHAKAVNFIGGLLLIGVAIFELFSSWRSLNLFIK